MPEETPETYQYDLMLTQREEHSLAVWIERLNGIERICCSGFDEAGLEEIQRLAPLQGVPRRPKSDGKELIWCEYDQRVGTLCASEMADKKVSEPYSIAPCADLDCGNFAVLRDKTGSRWLLTEVANGRLRLLVDKGDGWQLAAFPNEVGGAAFHPALCDTPEGILAVWADYADGKYQIRSRLMTSKGWADLGILPSVPGTWETLPALAVAQTGDVYAARCRERLIELPGGAANYHSELVLSILENRQWRDVVSVPIDHALNPWMAAYWGFRRYPRLASDADGIWLLWEEKIDEGSMEPSLGRLCALKVTSQGAQGDPFVLLRDEHHMVIESTAVAPRIVTATKTQPRGFMYQLPYRLHWINVAEAFEHRPEGLPDNADKPSFEKRTPSSGKQGVKAGNLSLFFGDPHVHSIFSYDLDPEPDELYHFARDVAALDFVALTDNDATRFTEPLTPGDREFGWRMADRFYAPGRFTTFNGWEYTLHTNPDKPESYDSHRSVIYPGEPGRIMSWVDDEVPTPPDLTKALQDERVLLHHHHPWGFDITDDAIERNIEIVSSWFNCMRRADFVEQLHGLLKQGFKLGFIGASDNHERNPGLGGALTGVWAAENSREAIFEAIEARRCFATTGLRPDLRFYIGDIPMGGEGKNEGAPTLSVQVSCDVPIQAVEIVRNGEKIHTENANAKAVDFSWTDKECPPGQVWYYVHVRFAPDQISGTVDVDWMRAMPLPWNVQPAYGVDAWTSPIWLHA